MPDPIAGESREDFLDRCIPQVVDEGRDPDQAVAICISMYEDRKAPYNVSDDLRQRYFKAFDAKRESFDRYYSRAFFKALMKQIEPLRDARTLQELEAPIDPSPIEEVMNELYGEVGTSFAQDSYIGLKRMAGYIVKEEEPLPDFILRMIRYVRDSQRIRYINGTTERELKRIIMFALEQGLSIDETRDYLMEQFDTVSARRAETIARTEIVSASNLGSLEGALATNVNFDKEWLSTNDSRMREFAKEDEWDHAKMNGVQVGRYDPFPMTSRTGLKDTLVVPGDPSGHPGNVINCRCTQIYRTIED